jgi:transcriptional regulator with XRE-family HTH domain
MSDKKSQFGEELEKLLTSRGMKKKNLAEMIDTSTAYVSSISTGKRNVSPGRVTSIGEALTADYKQMTRLHRAAAKDAGFELGLPDDFDD